MATLAHPARRTLDPRPASRMNDVLVVTGDENEAREDRPAVLRGIDLRITVPACSREIRALSHERPIDAADFASLGGWRAAQQRRELSSARRPDATRRRRTSLPASAIRIVSAAGSASSSSARLSASQRVARSPGGARSPACGRGRRARRAARVPDRCGPRGVHRAWQVDVYRARGMPFASGSCTATTCRPTPRSCES